MRCWTLLAHPQLDVSETQPGRTCELADGVGLPVVLAQVGVHEIHHVGPDGSLEHGGQRHVPARRLALLGVHGDQRPSASLGSTKIWVARRFEYKVRFCQVNCWVFNSSVAQNEGVVSSAVPARWQQATVAEHWIRRKLRHHSNVLLRVVLLKLHLDF